MLSWAVSDHVSEAPNTCRWFRTVKKKRKRNIELGYFWHTHFWTCRPPPPPQAQLCGRTMQAKSCLRQGLIAFNTPPRCQGSGRLAQTDGATTPSARRDHPPPPLRRQHSSCDRLRVCLLCVEWTAVVRGGTPSRLFCGGGREGPGPGPPVRSVQRVTAAYVREPGIPRLCRTYEWQIRGAVGNKKCRWKHINGGILPMSRAAWVGVGGGGGMPLCLVLVCSGRRLLADRHFLPFPWPLPLHRRWCPSAPHRPVAFLFLLALSFPLYVTFLSLGHFVPTEGVGGGGGGAWHNC